MAVPVKDTNYYFVVCKLIYILVHLFLTCFYQEKHQVLYLMIQDFEW